MFSPVDKYFDVCLDMAAYDESHIKYVCEEILYDLFDGEPYEARSKLQNLVMVRVTPRLYRICEQHEWDKERMNAVLELEPDITKELVVRFFNWINEYLTTGLERDKLFIGDMQLAMKNLPDAFETKLLNAVALN